MKTKILMIIVGIFISSIAILSQGREVRAAESGRNTYHQSYIVSVDDHTDYAESSGVSELDSARTRVDTLIEWACKWIGAIIALVALIAAIIMASSHQTEQRNQALVVMVFGVIIYFAPQIINYILNR